MFWIHRLDVQGKMVNIEEENVGIAGVTSRLSDEESGHFTQQIPVKFKRFGYRSARTKWKCYLT